MASEIISILIVLAFAGSLDGIIEGYWMTARKVFEKWKGIKPISYFGSLSYKLAYKDNDQKKGYKSLWRKVFGARDFYHHAEDLRVIFYMLSGALIALSVACFLVEDLPYKKILGYTSLGLLIGYIIKSPFKKIALDWIRSKNKNHEQSKFTD